MNVRPARIVSITVAAVVYLASIASAQTVHWGAKAGINSASVKAVPDYDDWIRLVPQFGPFLESAKNRDVAVLAGLRF